MRLTFTMSSDDYKKAFKLKAKKCKKNYKSLLACIITVIALLDVSLFTTGNYYYGIMAVICTACGIFYYNMMLNKTMNAVAEKAVTIKGEQTLVIEDGIMSVFNRVDKMSIELDKIFYAKLSSDSLIIIPSYRRGIVAIDINRYAGDELNELINQLTQNNVLKGKKNEN